MADMLVRLYDLLPFQDEIKKLQKNGIEIKRALPMDKQRILNFVHENFRQASPDWVYECEASLYNKPVTCFIAVKGRELVAFACYNATALGFFGPMGVVDNYRKFGIGKTILKKSLHTMYQQGYAYAIIGWVGPVEFYKKTVGAIIIPDSAPGIYKRLINYNEE